MFLKIKCLVLVFYFSSVLMQFCEDMTNCHSCIRHSSVCAWCASNDYNGIVRCKPASSEKNWCPAGPLENPINSKQVVEDRNFSSQSGNITQIKPQRYELKLRAGQPQLFDFSFKGAEGYPVDIYFLFDASVSMISSKEYTARQSENIYKTMKKMTNDVFLGMGSFVDKNTLPFTLNVTKNLAYSFKHHLNLTKDYKLFRKTVDETEPGENRDIQEGGLDALAQAIVCKNIIRWRNESRKILVFLSDGPYHAAGDGRSAGIFQPYDGNCHMKNNTYTKELQMDYPTVDMINKLARENEIIIIFAVKTFNYVYESLVKVITGSEMVHLDTTEENGIARTLKNIYEKITKSIKLNVKISGRQKSLFSLSVDPNCVVEDKACLISNDKEHKFTGNITLLKVDDNDRASVNITVEGINEKLVLDIELIKKCDCEQREDTSLYCNGEKRVCGECKCGEKRYGVNCACQRNVENNLNDDSTCFLKGMKKPCSGNGDCNCGVCKCKNTFSGRYCEYKLSCPIANGELCGGSGRGRCLRDHTCECEDLYSGKACECLKEEEKCKSMDTKKVCNGRGNCTCGSCECEKIAKWDKRNVQNKLCVVEPCPDCHDDQCKNLTECVICYLNGKDCKQCEHTVAEIFDELPNSSLSRREWNLCTKARVDVACYTNFTYTYDTEQYRILLYLQKKKDCAEIYYLYGGIFLLSLLLIGIFTLVAWKLLTEARDRQEYLRFVKDHEDSDLGPCENPLYEPATTTFRNPAFGNKSH